VAIGDTLHGIIPGVFPSTDECDTLHSQESESRLLSCKLILDDHQQAESKTTLLPRQCCHLTESNSGLIRIEPSALFGSVRFGDAEVGSDGGKVGGQGARIRRRGRNP
jgi:hypothetical protein